MKTRIGQRWQQIPPRTSRVGKPCRHRASGPLPASRTPNCNLFAVTVRARSGLVIRIAAWRPRPSGRGGNAASPPRKCQWCPIVCSYVPVPAAPHPRPGGGAAGPLRPRPVHLEPGRRAALPLAPRPGGRAGLPGAVPAAHPARAEYPWLAAGSQTVQQQALRDFAQAMAAFFDPANPAGRPSWRKAGRDEGFRITGRRGRQWDVRRVSAGRSARSGCPRPGGCGSAGPARCRRASKSYRVTRWTGRAAGMSPSP